MYIIHLEEGGPMVTFHELALDKKQNVYIQIITYVKRMILSGRIVHYEEMPSRRELAIQLSINPNTVQKAYKQLEEEGFIATISNVKSVVIISDEGLQKIRKEVLDNHVSSFVKDCKESGLNFQEVITLLTKYWTE